MNLDKFLLFWSQNNATIIEVLIALILLSVIYLAFRTFWGQYSGEDAAEGSSNFNSVEIERTLKKILETQNTGRVGILDEAHPQAPAGATAEGSSSTQPPTATQSTNVAGTTSTDAASPTGAPVSGVTEKDKQIEELKKELQQAKAAAAAAATVSAAPANAGAATSNADASAMEQKIKDLEARLSEYEIISEDIADLSFYKDENSKLQKELAQLRTSGTSAPAPVAPAPAAPAPVPATETPVAPVAAPSEVPATTVAASPITATAVPPASEPEAPAAVSPPEAAPVTASPESTAMDDDLMKEFAAAVEEQKSSTSEPNVDTNVKIENTEKLADNQNLLGEFENFMKKG